jgi:hypothetical protein
VREINQQKNSLLTLLTSKIKPISGLTTLESLAISATFQNTTAMPRLIIAENNAHVSPGKTFGEFVRLKALLSVEMFDSPVGPIPTYYGTLEYDDFAALNSKY